MAKLLPHRGSDQLRAHESRLAACFLSGVPGRVRAPCQLILRRLENVHICLGALDGAGNLRVALPRARTSAARRKRGSERGRIQPMAMLKADRGQFVEGVRVLAGMVKRKRQAKAIFTFDDGVLSIKVSNTIVEVRATGEWSGTATIGAQMLFISISSPPIADSVTLSVEGNRLLIERMSTLCEWVESKHRPLPTAH
jgi:hypothetical protein